MKREFIFCERIVMSATAFDILPTIDGSEPNFQGRSYRPSKAMITRGNRTCWHVVERQYHFGATVWFAHEIVIRLYVREAA